MNTMDIVNQYHRAAENFAASYGVSNPHIVSIIASVMMTRDKRGLTGGGFVTAVVANDLFKAVNLADMECYNHLKVIVASNQYAYLE
jgi:hypothetical protein